MTFDYNENLLQFIWEQQLYQKQELKTLNGESLIILKQGTLNLNSGPDFENAHIIIGKTEFFGSVEIHIHHKDWFAHNHQLDEAYNNVVLHVCFSASAEVVRQDGTKIPTLSLANRLDERYLAKYQNLLDAKSFIPCSNQIQEVSSFDLNQWLDRMAVERIETRCSLFALLLDESKNNWSTVFYVSLVRAFGMPINTLAFEELAAKLPLELIQKHSHSLFQLEALFFGVSGLLNESNLDPYYQSLQSEYQFLDKKYGLGSISTQLKSGRMRPMNLPHIKLAQIASLFYNTPDWINIIINSKDHHEIKRKFSFELSDYWLTHYTFKNESPPKSKKLSNQFLDHLFLNSIVPFLFLYETKKLHSTADKALEHLTTLPSESNNIVKQWNQLGVPSKSAHNSQALLHLYKTYCQKKLCLNCNIGRKILLLN